MNRIRRALAQSLATKVILSTVLLSLGVVWLTGSALLSRLSDGIRTTNLNSSLAEARFTFFNAQYQLALSEGESIAKRKKILEEVILGATTQGAKESRGEVLFLPASRNKNFVPIYEVTSPLIKSQSIPAALRTKVGKSGSLEYQYAPVNYTTGNSEDVLFVGQRIKVPYAGKYEMYIIFSLSSEQETLSLIKNSLLVTGFALLFLIGLITWLVVRQVVRPVREAARIATQFTQGDFTQRMKIESSDEMATLAHSYNEMAMSIEKQITRLENLSRVQQRFVSDVSHELRTPLTTLRMASEVIYNERDEFDPLVARSAELLNAQIVRFERLLEDLLEVSRFDAEAAVLEPVDLDLIALINRAVFDFNLSDGEKDVKIIVNSESKTVAVKADARRVERIMRNLLSNALDHAEGKDVIVTVVATPTEVGVGVRDYGSGLDESSLVRVFDRFWRADPSRARVRGGTGLGLSIALEDARLHNGELDAWGRLGKGAHFVLTLPRIAGEMIEGRPIKATPLDFQQ
jgi:two-component system sensor histidine kinase MtrB